MGYRHGRHTWRENFSDDPAANRAWYNGFMNWGHEAQDMGDFVYDMFKAGDLVLGGFCQLAEDQKKMGAPAHWLTYISVDDVAGGCGRAKEKGGQVLAEPFKVPGVGEIAILMDPQGGVFALFHGETEDPDHHNPPPPHGDYWWAEYMAKDAPAAVDFYTHVLGWGTQTMPMPNGEYTVFTVGEDGSCGCMAMPEGVQAPSHWSVYFAVDDVDAAAATATSSGGNILAGPMDMPGVGRFVSVADPQGSVVGLITPDLSNAPS